ncbi:MAG: IS200/IS605 family transposase [Terriglobia bacterium]
MAHGKAVGEQTKVDCQPRQGRHLMAHTFTNVAIHALFSTKRRRPFLDLELRFELFPYMGGIITRLKGQPLLINGPSDHVHLLFIQPATLGLSELMEKVKANSSRWVHQRWPERVRFAWQTGYTAFSVSQSQLEAVKNYIRNQEHHHQKRTFQEELVALLERHGIAYDTRFLLD